MGSNSSSGGYDAKALGQTFGTKLTDALNTKAPVYGKSLWAGMGDTTTSALNSMGKFASEPNATAGGLSALYGDTYNQDYTNASNAALKGFGAVASGAALGGQDEYFQRNLGRTLNDTKADVLSSLGASGGLGSDLQTKQLAESLSGVRDQAYTGERYYQDQRQQQAAGMLGGLYDNTLRPGQYRLGINQAQDANTLSQLQQRLGVGQAFDADAQGALQGEADLYDRTNNADYKRLLELLGAFNSTQGNAGMEEETPWWQQALGFGASLL